MWSIGIFELKLSEEEFWDITPAQFWALRTKYLESVEIADYRAGVIASQVYNINRPRGAKPLEPLDYFPHHKKRHKAKSGNRQMTDYEVKLRARIQRANLAKIAQRKKSKEINGTKEASR